MRAEIARKRRGCEVVGPDRDPRLGRQCHRQRVDEPSLRRADPFERRRHRVGRRDERSAQLLGQGASQGGGQLAAESRDVPVEAVVGHLVEGEQRDRHRDAVERPARLEAVAQRQRQVVGHRPLVGEVGERDGDTVGGAQHGGGQVELRRIDVAGVAPPPVELARRHDVVGQAGVVEVVHLVVVEQAASSGAILQGGHVASELVVVAEEGVRGVPLAVDEGVAHEHRAGERRVDPVAARRCARRRSPGRTA